MTLLLAVLLGVVVGALLGLVGAGGAIVAVPALVYGLGLPVRVAVPVSLMMAAIALAGTLLVALFGRAIDARMDALDRLSDSPPATIVAVPGPGGEVRI